MKTVVNADGSCYREFTSKNVSKEFFIADNTSKGNPFPVEIDSTWNILWKYGDAKWQNDFPPSENTIDSILEQQKNTNDSCAAKKDFPFFSVQIKKHFPSVSAMKNACKIKDSHPWKNIKTDYSLSKKFRWFYTYYIYQEKYEKAGIQFDYPIDDFLTEEEYLFWFTGFPNPTKGMSGMEVREYLGEIENKYEKWIAKNKWSWEYDFLLSNYEKISNLSVTKTELKNSKDSIFKQRVKNNIDFDMPQIMDSHFQTSAFSRFWNEENSPMKNYENDPDGTTLYATTISLFSENFNYKLILPGKIIKSNCRKSNDNEMVWELSAYRFLVTDYTIEAESRKTNAWAFAVSGIIILLALGSSVFLHKKKLLT
jgi:hypothetical protein